jgi:hypothetical protein
MAEQKQPSTGSTSGKESSLPKETLSQLERALHGLRYGTVTLSVQDGVIVQIERTEKVRLR